ECGFDSLHRHHFPRDGGDRWAVRRSSSLQTDSPLVANRVLLMKFCSACGQPVTVKIPEGDHLPRFVCTACDTIHYQNPRIIAGCVIDVDGKLLLCKRAIEPRLGYWTIPAGFMENGESVQAAAAREAIEEALAQVEIGSLLAVVSVVHANQVHIMFRARLVNPTFGVGP